MTTVTLATCLRNEGPYLLEWIAWHKLCGFQTIVLYDNGSDDGGRAILEPLAAAGEIVLRRQPDRPGKGPQFFAYADAARRCRSDWIVFLDLDEFLVIDDGRPVGDWLGGFPDTVSQVMANWKLFGSGGANGQEPGLVIERFRRAAGEGDLRNAPVKTATRSDLVRAVHPHAPIAWRGDAVHADGTPFAMSDHYGHAGAVRHAVARVHHYAVKSREEFERKIARGRGTRPRGPEKLRADREAYWLAHDIGTETDDTAFRRAEDVKAEMARLTASAAAAAAERSLLWRLRLWRARLDRPLPMRLKHPMLWPSDIHAAKAKAPPTGQGG